MNPWPSSEMAEKGTSPEGALHLFVERGVLKVQFLESTWLTPEDAKEAEDGPLFYYVF